MRAGIVDAKQIYQNGLPISAADNLTELVVFGDSWSDLTVTDSIWSPRAASVLDLNLHNYAINGAGFVHSTYGLISEEITTFTNDDTFEKGSVKYIVLLGGINDYMNGISSTNLANAILSSVNSLQSLCPQAKILYVSNCQYPYRRAQSYYWQTIHNTLSTSTSISTMSLDGRSGSALFNQSNFFHYTQPGQLWMARNIIASLTGGQLLSYLDTRDLSDTFVDIKYSAQIIDNFYRISMIIKPKQNFSSHTLTLTGGPNLSFGGDQSLFGIIGSAYVNAVTIVNTNNIVFASNTSLLTNTSYYFDITLPITSVSN